MNTLTRHFLPTLLALALLCVPLLSAEPVQVTLALDTNRISLGQTTVLRVFAQVAPDLRTNTAQIFSWYLDLLNTNASVALPAYDQMLKSASDNLPQLSSTGTADGPHRRGIYDTFLNLPGAGVAQPVELMAVSVTGASAGKSRFLAAPGSGVPALTSDFLVSPLGGGTPLLGGNYSLAFADLEVVQSCSLRLHIQSVTPQQLTLSFTPCPGFDHTILFQYALAPEALWLSLPGAPLNSGQLTITNSPSPRFFRLLALPR